MIFPYLKLVRFPNLLLIIATQALIKYSLFNSFGIAITLSNFGFFLLCLSTVCIAAAGNIINDVYDVETDRINKPKKQLIGKRISEKAALNLYLILTVIAVAIGFYLSNIIGHPGFSAIFIIISALLYLYATYIKQIAVVGNLLISILVGMVIIIMGIFDLLPAITPLNQHTQAVIFSILLDYAFFAFLINLIREMVKDQQDINGDYNTGRKSLPILLGKSRTNILIFLVTLVPFAGVLFYIYDYLYKNNFAVGYALIFIVAPLLYFMISIWNAESKKQYEKLSLLLKFIMLLGLLSIGLYPFILK
ncbi:MAG: geranylgeranylglycerol-phosphate geranylgeranyltransferase [Gillisia sp.]